MESYQEKTVSTKKDEPVVRPDVYEYSDFRLFLKDFYEYSKATNPKFSYGYFSMRAGLTSRNYLKRVMDGERPISSDNLPKFVIGLELETKEGAYFETLVNYNQAKDPAIQKYYFEQLKAVNKSEPSWIEISKHQYKVLEKWYIFPIFELLAIDAVPTDPQSIARTMRGKVDPKEVQEAIETLAGLGIIKSNPETGRWERTTDIIRYDKNIFNLMVRKFHEEMLKLSIDSVINDEVDDRFLKALSLAVPKSEIKTIFNKVDSFIKEINQAYSSEDVPKEELIQFNTQIIKLTNWRKK